MKLKAKFLSRKEPQEWEMEGRKGKTYRIQIMTAETEEAVTLKVSENFYMGVVENALRFGDDINVVLTAKVVLTKDSYGRAVQELKFIPDTFEFLTASAVD